VPKRRPSISLPSFMPPTAGDAHSGRQNSLQDLVLPEAVMKKLKVLVGIFANREPQRSQGVMSPTKLFLTGPAGSKKTSIIRALAQENGQELVMVSAADLAPDETYDARAKVVTLFVEARRHAPCIVFFDDLEEIAPARNAPNNRPWTAEVVRQLLL